MTVSAGDKSVTIGTNGAAPKAGQSEDDFIASQLKGTQLAAAGFKDNHLESLESAGLRSCHDLQAKMNQHGAFWAKEIGVSGRIRIAIEDRFTDFVNSLGKSFRKSQKEAAKAAS